MSDHWNSIANLLKTPSINPTAKKVDGPARPPKAASPVEPVVRNEEPESLPPESPKPKPEPSRLRSSWDAVATFFGVAAPELLQDSEPKTASGTDSSIVSKAAIGSKKTKPSMWGDSSDEQEMPAQPEKTIPRFEEKVEAAREPDFPRERSRGRERAPRSVDSDRSEQPVSEPTLRRSPPSDKIDETKTIDPERRSQRQQPRRGRQTDVRAETPFGESEQKPEAIIDDSDRSELESNDRGDFSRGDSVRPPRSRGQRSSSDGEREPRPERGSSSERAGRDDRAPRPQGDTRADRPPRPPRPENSDREPSVSRPERQPRPEGAARPARPEGQPRQVRGDSTDTDRPARSDRGDRSPRPDRPERAPRADVSDRGDRPARPDSSRTERSSRPDRPAREADRPPREEGTERPARADRSERPSTPRVERSNRDAPTERRPVPSSPPKKPSGFGVGIQDDDNFTFVDEPIETHDDFDFVQDTHESDSNEETVSEFGDRESRPRRRRGRGRRNGPRANDGEADADSRVLDENNIDEDDDSSDFISKSSRIPSWQETIGTLVAVNMENHQRNQSQNRSPRGRGPRRDR